MCDYDLIGTAIINFGRTNFRSGIELHFLNMLAWLLQSGLNRYDLKSLKEPSGPHRLHQWPAAQYLDDSLEVVSQYMQAHLRADPIQRLRQEVCRAHP